MSSSYSSLDWVLSHWMHFTVHSLDLFVFICVYFVHSLDFVLICDYFGLLFFLLHICCVIVSTLGGSNGIETQSLGPLFLQCFDTVGWVF